MLSHAHNNIAVATNLGHTNLLHGCHGHTFSVTLTFHMTAYVTHLGGHTNLSNGCLGHIGSIPPTFDTTDLDTPAG